MPRPKIASPKVVEIKFMASLADRDLLDTLARYADMNRSAYIRKRLGLPDASYTRKPIKRKKK